MTDIQPIKMPKWGLAMEEGMVARWMVDEGAAIAQGQEIMDIETSKIANAFESPVAGILRRRVADEGATLPVGALLGVVADKSTPDAELDSFIADFQANFTVAASDDGGGPTPEFVEAGGRRLRHLKAGDGGTPIVLIHGFGSDMTSWMFNQGDLAGDRAVYAVDLPGHGESAKDVGHGSLDELVAATTAYLDAAEIGRAHLVGHSLGGAIATRIAASEPERVSAVTLIAPAGFGADISEAFIGGFIAETRARKLRPVIEMLTADPSLITADMIDQILKFKRLDGALTALQAIAAANFPAGTQSNALRDSVGTISAPIQIIWGKEDRVLPAEHGDGLPASIAVTRIAGAGHLPHMEKAGEVNQLIRELG